MSKRKYQHIKFLEEEILTMKAEGKTKRAIAEHFGLSFEQIKDFLKRHNGAQRKLAMGILPQPKGRPRKYTATPEAQTTELERLRMENRLLRDLLQSTERM